MLPNGPASLADAGPFAYVDKYPGIGANSDTGVNTGFEFSPRTIPRESD